MPDSSVPDIIKNINTTEEQFESGAPDSPKAQIAPIVKKASDYANLLLTDAEQVICGSGLI